MSEASTPTSERAYANTDRELWREGDPESGMSYYEPSIHVTEQGGIGINVGGLVFVKTLREWHALAEAAEPPRAMQFDPKHPEKGWHDAVPWQGRTTYRHWHWAQRLVGWLWRAK